MKTKIEFDSTGFLEGLEQKVQQDWVEKGGNELLNDMYYVTRGAAPLDTGNLENSITHDGSASAMLYEGEIGVSAYAPTNGFDYGALRHDYPFNLGPGSAAKGGVTSPMTGDSYNVGYGFAARTEEGADGYFEYLQELINDIVKDYSE